MTIISNRKFRDDLANQGIKIVNELTKNPAGIVAAAKRDGKAAFLKKGKLTVRPRRPDSRTYAQVAADVTEATTEGNSTLGRSADRVNARGQMPREDRHRDGDSPRAKKQTNKQTNNSGRERHTRAHANRGGVHTEFAHRQSGLFDYWRNSRSPPQSTSNESEDRTSNPAALSEPDDVRTGRTTHTN